MSSPFPTEWRVLPSTGFEDFTNISDISNANRTMVVMMLLNERHRYTGTFRIRYVGGEAVTFRIPAAHILPRLPDQFQDSYFEFTGDNDDVSPPRGSTTTSWMDLEELVRMRVVLMTKEDRTEINPADLLQYMQSTVTDKEPVGASVRWTADVDNGRSFRLQLQCLPTPAKYLQKAHLQGENSVSVVLGGIPVDTVLFDDPTIEGPVPLFFSDNPTAAASYLQDHPVTVREDIAAVNARFLSHETLSMSDAMQFLRKHRRAAKGTQAFPPIRPSAAKRRKTHASNETGRTKGT